jgi:hypothetical protein
MPIISLSIFDYKQGEQNKMIKTQENSEKERALEIFLKKWLEIKAQLERNRALAKAGEIEEQTGMFDDKIEDESA